MQLSPNSPIGVFDSGIGGLTVVGGIGKIMPNEDVIYFGDTARLPYGSKSVSTIMRYSVENTVFLSSKGIKAVVVACNTASAIAIDYLRSFMKLPAVGVIEGGALGAVRATKNKKVGVIGTKATIKSNAYSNAISSMDPSIEVYQVATPLLVHLVEENWIDKSVTKSIINEYLGQIIKEGIDTLVLGCTHYPYLCEQIAEIAPSVTMVDSTRETALLLLNTLKIQNMLSNQDKNGEMTVFLSDDHPDFSTWAKDFIGRAVPYSLATPGAF